MVMYSSDETASSGLRDVPNWAFYPAAELSDFGILLQINLNLPIQWQLYGYLCCATRGECGTNCCEDRIGLQNSLIEVIGEPATSGTYLAPLSTSGAPRTSQMAYSLTPNNEK